MDNGKEFRTQDINLASYLHAKGIFLRDIKPLDLFSSEFIFDKPPKELLDYWLSGSVAERRVINSYRHLIKDARNAQFAMRAATLNALKGGGR